MRWNLHSRTGELASVVASAQMWLVRVRTVLLSELSNSNRMQKESAPEVREHLLCGFL